MKADEIPDDVVEAAMLAWHRGVEGGDDDCDCLADSDVIDEYRRAMRGVLAAAWPLIASLVLADMAAEPAETWHRDALRARALLWLDGEGPDQPAGEARLTDAGWVRETTEVRAVSHGGHLDLYGPAEAAQDGQERPGGVSGDSGACGGGCEAAGALRRLTEDSVREAIGHAAQDHGTRWSQYGFLRGAARAVLALVNGGTNENEEKR